MIAEELIDKIAELDERIVRLVKYVKSIGLEC